MAKLTLKVIRNTIAKDPRIDQNIDLDEEGKVIVYLNDGWTWDPRDGNRSVEGFIISKHNADNDPVDTVDYWRQRIANIEQIV